MWVLFVKLFSPCAHGGSSPSPTKPVRLPSTDRPRAVPPKRLDPSRFTAARFQLDTDDRTRSVASLPNLSFLDLARNCGRLLTAAVRGRRWHVRQTR